MQPDQHPHGRKNTVKRRLTPRPPVENDEYAAFVRRIFRAYARRIASGDIDALAGMVTFTADIEAIIQQVVTGLRAQHGYSWAEIGLRLGVTRQAAQQRWGTQPLNNYCPEGCGCRLGTDDADAREGGCDGPCTGESA